MIQVYTAICGDKDLPRRDILCFNGYNHFKNPRLNAKIYKVLSHHFIDAEYSIWIDGNIKLRVEPELLVEMMGTADCAVFRHCERNNIYDEARFIAAVGKDDAKIINEQIAAYRNLGFKKLDLGMCGVLIRRHTADIFRRNERWWAEICRYSSRDQVSFPVVFDGAVKYFDTVPLTSNKFFTRAPHQK